MYSLTQLAYNCYP
ncbi:unnamed protein product [Tuber melanosporum]|uniref:(Perigord truffle) hypothetical protein n=1 Tax=Tuber melanosporum (strain Mel28) TaxID=656061 RepID=D5GDY8_TUBMM|nr:unnamed protein product [Tuber melanosporum]